MRISAIAKILGIFLMIFSVSMLPPIGVSLFYGDQTLLSFLTGFLVTFFSGVLLWWPFRHAHHELKTRDGFLVVTLFWAVLSIFAAIPLLLSVYPKLTFTNAMFESVSGLTTTGASVLSHLEQLPRSILYYRQQLHLLGGMGIIVLAVAILPMLGIGGMQLYRAETVGPIKTAKLKPRMTQTAKALWMIYVGLVVLCAVSYWGAGMDWFDAIGESFSTVATGGFSTHSASFSYYHSTIIDMIAVLFMIAGATNFALHFQLVRRRRLSVYWRDPEFSAYLWVIFIATALIAIMLIYSQQYTMGRSTLNAFFTAVSVATTTGFTNSHFNLWPSFLPFFIMFLAFIGGCGGSTSGGIKVMRMLLLKQQGARELKRLIHPKVVFSIKLGKSPLPDAVIQSIWSFFAVFILISIVLFLGLLAVGLDVTTAFGALASCISNTGASIGATAESFVGVPTVAKWMLIFAMIAGRLEVFTLLVLFAPSYWRK
jgi:trk system potassium uptake protein